MSLEFTKCDLSAGIAKIDLKALTNQTENRFYSLMEQLGKKVNEARDNSMTKEDRKETLLSMVSHGSQSIMRLSSDIAVTAELLYTLYNTDDRKIEIVS